MNDLWLWLGTMGVIAIFLIIVVSIILYFIPTIIGAARKKTNTGAIFLVNLFFGWSLIGWIVALVWAFSSDHETKVIIHNSSDNNLTNIPNSVKIVLKLIKEHQVITLKQIVLYSVLEASEASQVLAELERSGIIQSFVDRDGVLKYKM